MYQYRFDNSLHEAKWRAPGIGLEEPQVPRITSAVTLFADIVGYTEHCETLDPEGAFLLLSDFYRRAGGAAGRHDAAIVDHFGDEMLAVWTGKAPLAVQAFRALRCGFAILVEMERWNEQRRMRDLRAVKVGIGIHAGPVLSGQPSADERGRASVFGDTVNIASRLERQTRRLDADIVISEEMFRLAGEVAGDTALLQYFPATVQVTLSGRARPLQVRPAALHQRPSRSMKECA